MAALKDCLVLPPVWTHFGLPVRETSSGAGLQVCTMAAGPAGDGEFREHRDMSKAAAGGRKTPLGTEGRGEV